MNNPKIKSTLLEALRQAGKLLPRSINERKVVQKKSALSIVTATDCKAEKTIIKIIKKAFPDHSVLAEESLASGSSPHRWIIDPLDGTTNFAHTYPVACISIAYEMNGVVRAGGVYDPFRKELFFAQKKSGAFLNGRRIHVSKTAVLGDALLVTGFPYDRRKRAEEYLRIVKDFMMRAQGIRRTGSAAMDLCYVGCGRFDGYWEAKLNPWDVAAGALILSEAGGKITDFSGNSYRVDGTQTLASNGKLHSAMMKVLIPHRGV